MWDLLKRWQELTASERDAIMTDAWDALEARQLEKRELQDALTALLDTEPVEAKSKGWLSEWQMLIQEEKNNADLLSVKMSAVKKEISATDRQSRRLGQVRTAYQSSGDQHWASYS